ncbi:MAG: sulfite exporter TauE/SafE family protein [Clostridia bacterium]|nr:sulfite exporter TauE/SafE family protein [Clostridia bacterium]
MNYLLFYIVILLSNIVQGITGFAGTILAMPFSLKLVGMGTAVPVLNALGMASGIYVFLGNRKSVDRAELKRILVIMGPALVAGLVIRTLLSGRPGLLYSILGVIVLLIAVKGLYSLLLKGKHAAPSGAAQPEQAGRGPSAPAFYGPLLLAGAGLVHGMFVCGGPLLIGYLAGRIGQKDRFRATISTVWIFLNGFLLITQIAGGQWTPELLKVQLISLPFLIAGMFAGSLLYKRMSQRFFMILTYVLLLISALSLFFK